MFVPVYLEDILNTIQELVEGCLVRQDEHVEKERDCTPFVGQIFCELVELHDSFLDQLHIFSKLHTRLFLIQNPIDDSLRSCLILD